MLNRLRWPVVFLVVAVPAACTTDGGDEPGEAVTAEEAAEAQSSLPEEKLMFDCKPAASSPHPVLQVHKVEEDAEAQDPDEVAVVIDTNNVEPGVVGTCGRRPYEGDAQAVRYACVSADENLRMYWPADAGTAVPAEAQVEVMESWLFWTKNYTATCAIKAM